MQSFPKRTTSGTSKPPLSSHNTTPHKYSRRLHVTQKHLPHAAKTIKTRPDPITISTLIYNYNTTIYNIAINNYVKLLKLAHKYCKYPVVYRLVEHGL